MAGETASLTRETISGAHRVLEYTQVHPPMAVSASGQHLEEHNLFVGGRGSERIQGESQASNIVPSLTPPYIQ